MYFCVKFWHSLWAVAKAKDGNRRLTADESLFDFHTGYVGSFILAVCFVLLGTGVMHNSGAQFEADAAGFAAQLIELYKQALGDWSGPLIGVIAVAVIFSTVLAGMDGYARAAVGLYKTYTADETSEGDLTRPSKDQTVYISALLVLVVGSICILYLFVTSLKLAIDVAATILFFFAPIIAWLNHRSMTNSLVPLPAQPGRGLRALSIIGVVWMFSFSAYFLWLKFFG